MSLKTMIPKQGTLLKFEQKYQQIGKDEKDGMATSGSTPTPDTIPNHATPDATQNAQEPAFQTVSKQAKTQKPLSENIVKE